MCSDVCYNIATSPVEDSIVWSKNKNEEILGLETITHKENDVNVEAIIDDSKQNERVGSRYVNIFSIFPDNNLSIKLSECHQEIIQREPVLVPWFLQETKYINLLNMKTRMHMWHKWKIKFWWAKISLKRLSQSLTCYYHHGYCLNSFCVHIMKTFDFWYIGVHGHANVQCCPGSHGLKNVQAYCSNSVWGHIHGLILIHQGQLIHFGKSCFITQWPTLMMDCYKGFHVQMQIWGVGVRSYGMGLLAYSEPQSRKKEFSIDDYLVMATDAEVNTFNTLGVVEYLHFIKEVKDAQKIRRSVMNCFEKAILSVLTKEERRISLINLVELIRGSVPNGDMTVWVQDPSSIIQILGISFICGLLRTKAFEGERLSRGGGGEVWSIYHQRVIGYCSLDSLLVIRELLNSWYSTVDQEGATRSFLRMFFGTALQWGSNQNYKLFGIIALHCWNKAQAFVFYTCD
ncbi:putative NADH:ubiquinone reductase (non-electrogenic) [Helianthus annuus]|nr:putative NADH:ubiquinone reductase (non-electrogenic) [Helianthus annuus]KAJ0908781.1 putative NADH:ubiquinone reductase (non-electrogenic) [Helianthus annuus]